MPRHKSSDAQRRAGRSWTGRQLTESKEARDEMLRVVAGGPGKQHVRALLARQLARQRNHQKCADEARQDALALRSYLPENLVDAAAHHYENRRKMAAFFRSTLKRQLPELTADATLGDKVRTKNRHAALLRGTRIHARTQQVDRKIAAATHAYRAKHPYSAAHSTRALAAQLARKLNRPEGTIRRRLRALKLR